MPTRAAPVPAVVTARQWRAMVPVPAPVLTARRREAVGIALASVDRAQVATLLHPVALVSVREAAASAPGGLTLAELRRGLPVALTAVLTIASRAPVAVTGHRQRGAEADDVAVF